MFGRFLCICFFALSMFACNSGNDTEKITIASETRECAGVGRQQCLLVKTDGQNDWEYLYNSIEGFNYQPGYEYEIEIKKEQVENPAADQSSIRYIFVKEVSKTQKVSENLPPANI